VKLPGHPVRTGQAGSGFPGMQWREGCEQRKYRFNCAPSCLPVGRDPAYKLGLGGHLPATLFISINTAEDKPAYRQT
jgi:hypothetical protein